jgi:hypothetical protein
MRASSTRSECLSALVLLVLCGCASAPAPVQQAEQVNHIEYGRGLYQLKIVSHNQGLAAAQWQSAATRLCPAGFEEFDVSNAVTLDPGRPDPNTQKAKSFLAGGLMGLAMDDSEQNNGAIKTGYVLCAGSEFDIAAARTIVYGRN